jgi:dihydroorotase-like cyclic amidohydrolase
VFDPAIEWQYTAEGTLSKSRNSPFIGRKLVGKILHAVVGSRVFRF